MTLPLWMANNLKIMLKKITFLFLFILSGSLVLAQTMPPKSNTLVTDSTNTLSADQKAQLEQKLVAFDDSTTTQIAVVILNSVGNNDINQYGAALIRAWGIGQKGKNNGILILVALADHKVSIQTGYGAEASVPDIVTHDIIQNDITPNFKQGKYYEGLDAATNSLMAHIKGEYQADAKPQSNNNNVVHGDGDTGSSIGIIVFIVIFILIIIFRNRGGGGGHIIGRRGGANPFWWFLAGSYLGGSSNNGGGFFGGNDSGSGGDSGGGFGGFGGGDSGGGGSSGSW
jgi:uncharacterized protein